MSGLAPVKANLEFIKQKLIQHSVFGRRAGLPIDDPAYFEETKQLEELGQRLGILLREINNRRHLLAAQEQALWRTPREARYTRISSINQQKMNVRDFLQTAADVQKLLEDLIHNCGVLSEAEMAKGLGEIVTNLYEQSHHPGIAVSGSPAYVPLLPGQCNASPEAATIAVFIALHAWLRLRKRMIASAA